MVILYKIVCWRIHLSIIDVTMRLCGLLYIVANHCIANMLSCLWHNGAYILARSCQRGGKVLPIYRQERQSQ